ncbi:unnamed protein product, partial [Pocillopora meandrina]
CCRRKCIGDIPVQYVTKKREEFWSKTIQERNEVITTPLPAEVMAVYETVFSKAWCTIHGFSISSQCTQPETQQSRKKSLAFNLTLKWFRGFSKNAEQMPNSSSRQLPSCLTKNEGYTLYKEEMGDNPTLSLVHLLYKMWKVNFPDVYIPKQSRFTKCTICEQLKA